MTDPALAADAKDAPRVSHGTIGGPQLFAQQIAALVWKNALVKWRNKSSLILQIGSAFVMLLLVLGIEEAIKQEERRTESNRNIEVPTKQRVGGIPDCTKQFYIKTPCYTFAYTPNNDSAVEEVVKGMRENNLDAAIPLDKVKGFPTVAEKDAWLLANTQRCQAGIEFTVSTLPDNKKKVDFGIQVNGTVKASRGTFEDPNFYVQLPLQQAAEREITRFTLKQAGMDEADFVDTWDVSFRKYPHPAIEPFSLVGAIGSTFIFAAAMFTYVMQLNSIVGERELKLRQALRNVGTSDFTYWVSWVVTEFIVCLVQAALILAWGNLFGFQLFLKNDSSVTFTLLLLFQLAMAGFGFCTSVFLRSSALATMYGFVVFLLGFILTLVVGVAGGEPFTKGTANGKYKAIPIIFAFFPPTLLAKGLGDLGKATASSDRGGIKWSQIDSYCKNNVYSEGSFGACDYSLEMCYELLTLDFFFFTILAMYLDQVLPNEFGVNRPFYFPFLPSTWMSLLGMKKSVSSVDVAATDAAAASSGGNASALEEDVAEEEMRLKQSATEQSSAAMLVQGLVKSFYSLGCRGGGAAFHAVKGNWFEVKTGELFGLLGPNGAGKSTTINLMTGVLPCTAGDGYIYGTSVVTDIGGVRTKIGVCPQFDILWGELTGEEHMYLFSALRGLPYGMLEQETLNLLGSVKLLKDRKVETRAYSGGMRRRLSVAISLIGDPQVVFLDEPTTGMDPIHRRHVWDIILEAKAGRAIVLTTHSMEEADALSDRIGIIAGGRLRCLASSVRLKRKFGTGYSVAISLRADRSGSGMLGGHKGSSSNDLNDAVDDPARVMLNTYFRDGIDGELEDAAKSLKGNGKYMHFRIPRESDDRLSSFLRQLDEDAHALGVNDVQVTLATLDEVFLSIAKKAALEGSTKMCQIPIELPNNGGMIMLPIPLGTDYAQIGGTNYAVRIEWITDADGNIVYGDHTLEEMSATPQPPPPDA